MCCCGNCSLQREGEREKARRERTTDTRRAFYFLKARETTVQILRCHLRDQRHPAALIDRFLQIFDETFVRTTASFSIIDVHECCASRSEQQDQSDSNASTSAHSSVLLRLHRNSPDTHQQSHRHHQLTDVFHQSSVGQTNRRVASVSSRPSDDAPCAAPVLPVDIIHSESTILDLVYLQHSDRSSQAISTRLAGSSRDDEHARHPSAIVSRTDRVTATFERPGEHVPARRRATPVPDESQVSDAESRASNGDEEQVAVHHLTHSTDANADYRAVQAAEQHASHPEQHSSL